MDFRQNGGVVLDKKGVVFEWTLFMVTIALVWSL